MTQRTEKFQLRLTPDERASLDALAQEAGMKPAAYIRHRCCGSDVMTTERPHAGDADEVLRRRINVLTNQLGDRVKAEKQAKRELGL